MAEAEVDEPVEIFLHEVEKGEGGLAVFVHALPHRLPDEVKL